jgi:hypothetical protein
MNINKTFTVKGYESLCDFSHPNTMNLPIVVKI